MRWLALTLLAGCTTIDSSDILTSGMYASITAEATGNGRTDVGATLYVGNPIGLDFVNLTGDDSLVARYGTQSKTMVETNILNIVSHHADFAADEGGAEFEVIFDRSVDAGAPSSIATLPARFDLVDPGPTASRASLLTLEWSPSNSTDEMSWSAQGDCIDSVSSPISGDPGSVAIAPNTLIKRMGTMIADQCEVTFTIERSRDGILDPHFGKGGTVVGTQSRRLMITSTP